MCTLLFQRRNHFPPVSNRDQQWQPLNEHFIRQLTKGTEYTIVINWEGIDWHIILKYIWQSGKSTYSISYTLKSYMMALARATT